MIDAKKVHLIGIGGIGVSAAAKWWKMKGTDVSGSDMHQSEIIEDLEQEGIQVKIGHFADNIPRECDLVIYSDAVPATNVERQAAEEQGIMQMSYFEFLGEIAKDHKTIAVSGTNGKSTTTAMLANILIDAGLDPTVILGTKVPGWEHKNFRMGGSNVFVVEACEHMQHMLYIKADIAVITNIEEDHLDFYRDIDHIREAFQEWVDKSDFDVLNATDPESKKLNVENVTWFNEGDISGVELKIPGAFNRMNAAAAAVAARHLGVTDDQIKSSLEKFKGTWRRFEHVGAFNGADVYSDYAHHPTAIEKSLAAYKEFYPDRRLLVCFEPHQYSRTAELFDDFVTCFASADALVLSEVYEVAGRNEFAGKTSKDLAEAIQNVDDVQYAENLDTAEQLVRELAKPDDVIVAMGAGDIDRVARKLVE